MSEEAIVQINYWKEIRKELYDTINELHGRVLLTHNSMGFSDVINFLNQVKKEEHLTVLYISLINSYNYIIDELEKKPLDNKKLFVVDCVSGFVQDYKDTPNCFYRNTPSNLEEMKNLIKENLTYTNPNIIVIDSLSQFINFTNPKDNELSELYKFLQSIREDTLGITCYAIILLYDDKMGSMKKLPILFTDLVLKLEVIKERTLWQD